MVQPVTKSSAVRQIEAFVKGNPGATFPEVMRLFGEWSVGDTAMTLSEFPNLILWVGMSQGFVEALEEAQQLGLIHRRPSTVLVYAVDGQLLGVPVATKVKREGIDKWLPVTFSPGEFTVEKREAIQRAARRERWREIQDPKSATVINSGLSVRRSPPLPPGSEVPADQVERCRTWIRAHGSKTPRRQPGIDSYGLKHLAEDGCEVHGCDWRGEYVSNGAMIKAAILEGYRVWGQTASQMPLSTCDCSLDVVHRRADYPNTPES
jgi:hypothetical protein